MIEHIDQGRDQLLHHLTFAAPQEWEDSGSSFLGDGVSGEVPVNLRS